MTATGRVLIIDDDELVARMLATHVRAVGHDVRVTADPDEFLDIALEWKPTHVCVDLVMGATDGLEVLSRLAEQGSEAAVIITSGMGTKVLDAAQSFAAANGLAYTAVLPKPFNREDVALVLAGLPKRQHEPGTPVDVLAEWPHDVFARELRAAVANGQITVVYQPKVACATGKVVGFEVLARWFHPTMGNIPPTAFIPRAESVGLVSLITDTVLATALAWFGEHRHSPLERMAINISGSELSQRERVADLRDACVAAGVEPSRIILELTETAALDDATTSLEILTRLRLEGFHLSIDDFGTGYSSMMQLRSLPFDELKIDRSFVAHCTSDRASEVMVRSAIELARGLELEVTAEGVEDLDTLALLAELGCDNAQGYAIARPLDGDNLLAWLAAH